MSGNAVKNLILPNPAAAASIRDEVRMKLFESMHHMVFEVFGEKTPPPISVNELRILLLHGPRFPGAALFALHAALLDAVGQGDTSEVPALFRILGDMMTRETGALEDLVISPLCETRLHGDDILLLKRVFADDSGLTANLIGPPEDEGDRAEGLITEALAGLDHAAPVWGEELRLFANHVYLASARDEDAYLFGGAAVFDAFGAVLMNPLGLQDHATTLMALIHESSHQQMFLFHLNDPVVLNDADAAFSSPLRTEPRPMEGVFHAMWVSARMFLAADAVRTSPHRPNWTEDLGDHQSRALCAFRDCVSTVAEHALLTELGTALFECAQETVDGL